MRFGFAVRHDHRDLDVFGEAWQEFFVDDEQVDAVAADAAVELVAGGSDVEQVDGGACVAFGGERVDAAAAVAGHHADAEVLAIELVKVAG